MDVLGYLASGLNLISMTMKDLRRLRLFSLCANGLFVAYGFTLGAYPIVVSCSIAVLIHAYQLYQSSPSPSIAADASIDVCVNPNDKESLGVVCR